MACFELVVLAAECCHTWICFFTAVESTRRTFRRQQLPVCLEVAHRWRLVPR